MRNATLAKRCLRVRGSQDLETRQQLLSASIVSCRWSMMWSSSSAGRRGGGIDIVVAVRGKEAVLTHAGLHPDLVRRACGRCDSIFDLLVVDTVLLALRFSKFDASFRTLDVLTLGISITCIVNVVYNRTIWQAHRASVLKLFGGERRRVCIRCVITGSERKSRFRLRREDSDLILAMPRLQ